MAAHLFAFVLAFLVLGAPAMVVVTWLRGRSWCPVPAALLTGGGVTALLGYVGFWAWFLRPWVGVVWTVVALGTALFLAWRERAKLRTALAAEEVRRPLRLMLVIGLGYLGVLHLFASPFGIDQLAANRFLPGLPVDNEIPRMFAERLRAGVSPRALVGDWLSSDRPPLQTGIILLAWPPAKAAGIDFVAAAHAAGLWFQLLWVPAIWAFFAFAGIRPAFATVLVALLATTSLGLLHSLYVWPKLGAAALTVGAFLFYADGSQRGPARLAVAGVLAGLGWLAHGGNAFSLIALAGLALFWRPWPRPAALVAGILGGAVLMAPWLAYQKFYEPPGNRLLKWHLAGVIPPDRRGTLETLVTSYRTAGWRTAWENRRTNLQMLVKGAHAAWFDFHPSRPLRRRTEQFFYFFHSLGYWNLALLLAPVAWWRARRNSRLRCDGRAVSMAGAWLAGTLAVWVLLMFLPDSASIHQGSLAANLVAFALAFVVAAAVHRYLFAALALVHCAAFALMWLPASSATPGSVSIPAAVTALGAAGVLAAWCWRGMGEVFAIDPDSPRRRLQRGLRAAFAVAALALLFASLRLLFEKPRPLPPLDRTASSLGESRFQPEGVYPSTSLAALPRGLAFRGSWVGSDEFQGTHETGWYRARTRFTLLVAGYPALAPNRLELDVRNRDGSERTIRFAGENPHETLRPWEITLDRHAIAVRVRAVDASSAPGGWLAFSEPF